MSPQGKPWVSACLAARVNAAGRSVTISLWKAGELPEFGYERIEGAFWGNLFQAPPPPSGGLPPPPPPVAFSCKGPHSAYAYNTWSRYCTAQDCGLIHATRLSCQPDQQFALFVGVK